MAQIIQMRRDTAANWTSVNPTLRDGEFGVEKDTGEIKMGDGVTPWNTLGYVNNGYSMDEANKVANLPDDTNASLAAITNRVDDIITTPVPTGEIIAQEIIDARQGKTSVGANISEVKSQLAETMNKTAVTLSHQFADNTDRDAYFVANPTELVEQVFIKVGTAYQQYLNSAWAASSPILVEVVNQIDDASLLTTKTWSASKINTTKADKTQEAWITPTLLNAWVTNSYIDTPKYRKNQFGMIEIKGAVKSGTAGTVAFTLPVGYRPSYYASFLCFSQGTTLGKIQINPVTGEVTVQAYSTYIYLSQIQFQGES